MEPMTIDEVKIPPKQEARDAAKTRLPYKKPQIVTFGDIRDVTLGMTPGIGDSGNPALFRP